MRLRQIARKLRSVGFNDGIPTMYTEWGRDYNISEKRVPEQVRVEKAEAACAASIKRR